MNFEAGTTIGAYKLLKKCGEGAYGAVFLAENTLTGQRVALKTVFRTEQELKGIIRYQTLCRQTNLLRIYHTESAGAFFYYTMDAADDLAEAGEPYLPDTLANRLRRSGRLTPEQIRTMTQELLEALETLHNKGLMHRDLKPENILWINGRAVPGDVGLISDHTVSSLAGTPGFMPAEVLAGIRPYEKKDDLYALGKVIYCSLTGMPPEKYPAFPESGTLTGCADIISLYNKLCAGEAFSIPAAGGTVKNHTRAIAAWLAAGIGITVLTATALLLLFRRPAETETPAPVSPPAPVRSEPAAQPPQKPVLQRLAELEKKYASSPDFWAVENCVTIECTRLVRLQNKKMTDAWKQGAGDEKKQFALAEEAVRAFEKEYSNSPEWQYRRTLEKIDYATRELKRLAERDPAAAEMHYKELIPLLRTGKDLEEQLVRKYKK